MKLMVLHWERQRVLRTEKLNESKLVFLWDLSMGKEMEHAINLEHLLDYLKAFVRDGKYALLMDL